MTSRTIRPAAVRKSMTVKADAARAFAVFTGRIGSWWPHTHCIGSSPQKDDDRFREWLERNSRYDSASDAASLACRLQTSWLLTI
jgi:hypothetical protein